jgi:hypothetical protein
LFLYQKAATKREFSMLQKDVSLESLPHAFSAEKTGDAVIVGTFFPVTGNVTYKPLTEAPAQEARRLPGTITRLISTITLSAALLFPLSACTSTCSPASKPTVTAGTPQSGIGSTSSCSSSSGG